jgi:hypothetical protein
MINRPCEKEARTLAPCRASTRTLTVDAAVALPADGRVVSVRGPLELGHGWTTLVGCGPFDPLTQKPLPRMPCCNHVGREMLVGQKTGKAITIEGIACAGDESRVCCDLPVSGQTVVVTGKLLRDEEALGAKPTVKLGGDVKVCAADPPPTR